MTAFEDEELKPDADDLLVFIDDTGHETFAGNQGFYGLGGCVVLGAGYAHLKQTWCAVRKAINGDPDLPLHASELERKVENFAVLSEFFLDPSFIRIAATTTKAVSLPSGMDPCVPVMGQLQNEIVFVADALACKKVWIILESSQRADGIVQTCFSQLVPVDAAFSLPVVKSLMPKSSNEPGLEVADFIVSAASSEVQRRLRGQDGHAPDFNDVFCRLPALGCRYREVSHVTVDENGIVGVSGVALVPQRDQTCQNGLGPRHRRWVKGHMKEEVGGHKMQILGILAAAHHHPGKTNEIATRCASDIEHRTAAHAVSVQGFLDRDAM